MKGEELGALPGSMTMTSAASTLDLLQPSARTSQTMHLRTCSQFDDAVLMAGNAL
jgi:hypothetical protein